MKSRYSRQVEGKSNPRYIDGRTLKTYNCKECGVKIGIHSGVYGTGQCRKCADKNKDVYLDKNSNWKGGKSFEYYPLGWNKTHREQIRYRDGYKCQLCGMPEVENGRRLDVHHIDYNKNNIDSSNLISLCMSCHTKTNYKREKWINLFQKK